MRFVLLLVFALFAGVLFAACGSDDGDGGNGEPAEIESPVDDADDASDGDGDDIDPDDGDVPDGDVPADDANDDADDGDASDDTDVTDAEFSLPESGLAAPLTDTYDNSGAEFSEANLPIAPGSVIARWYQSGGLYVVYYDGLDLAVTGPLCPGNSIQTPTGFEFVTNAPTGAGACQGANGILQPPNGVQLCGDDVLYVTAIRVATEGTLYGTIERYRDDGTIIGLTSQVTADSVAAPDVDLSSCATP